MTRTLADAFAVTPHQWGVRGDPHVWHAMSERLAGVPIPEGRDAVRAAYVATFNEVVGADLDSETERYLRRDEFDHGGMSGGLVDVEWWRTKGVPHLVDEACR